MRQLSISMILLRQANQFVLNNHWKINESKVSVFPSISIELSLQFLDYSINISPDKF